VNQTLHLSVIVGTWNRAASLAEALSSIDQSELPPSISWEVLVVDNNSTDNTREVCQDFIARNPARFRYLFEKRQGKSFALNTGIAGARGDILVFTDDDVTVDKRWLAETIKIFDAYPCIGVGGRIVDVWQGKKPSWLSLEGPYKLMAAIVKYDLGDEPRALRTPPFGANLALKKAAFATYGGFRTDLGPTAGKEIRGEDTELCWRILHDGETMIYAPSAIVFHPVAESRISKRYFEEWYYAFGQATARMERAPERTTRYFGFPRYMLRSWFGDLCAWVIAFPTKRRFFYKLQAWNSWGRLMEERRLWREQQAEKALPR
jgi:glucosyl-dolichyl phosphate glucuronosyltransferase